MDTRWLKLAGTRGDSQKHRWWPGGDLLQRSDLWLDDLPWPAVVGQALQLIDTGLLHMWQATVLVAAAPVGRLGYEICRSLL